MDRLRVHDPYATAYPFQAISYLVGLAEVTVGLLAYVPEQAMVECGSGAVS